ncbi:MAG: hypothetical protein Q4D65_09560 [Peptostreptococcaceae bacterium]|nr:hypothetical protein [Peptostreptococcaceae bacterium]
MKKIIAILICLVLSFHLAGCGRTSREFSMDGHNVSSLNTKLIIEKIIEFEKLDEQPSIDVNATNSVMLTSDFDWADDGAISFFYKKEQNTYSAQLRIFNEENKYFITESTKVAEQERIFKLEHYLDALKYMPQKEIRKLSPGADKYLLIQVESGNPDDYEKSVIYCPNGLKDSNEWLIHISVQPLNEVDGSYTGSGNEVIHLFYINE